MDKLTHYHVRIHEGEPDEGGYWAEVLELPGCFTQGDTWKELLTNIGEAIEAYLFVADNLPQEQETPPPAPAPFIRRFNLRDKKLAAATA